MKMLATKEELTREYGLQPSQVQINNSVIKEPAIIRMLRGIIVESKIVSKRKHYLMGFGTISASSSLFIAADILEIPESVVHIRFLAVLGDCFNDLVIDSLVVYGA
jgi:hypothetical protein